MTNDEKIQVKDRLFDLIERLHEVRELVDFDDVDLANALFKDAERQVRQLALMLKGGSNG